MSSPRSTPASDRAGVPLPREPDRHADWAPVDLDTHFRGLLESAPDAMIIVNSEGEILLANRQTEKMFGYRPEELSGSPVELLVPGHLRDRHRALRAGFVQHPSVRPMGQGLELLGARKDGSAFPVEISLAPLPAAGSGTLYCAAVRDVTARKDAERALRESEERFRLTVDASPIGMALLDLDGHLLHVNDALCDLTGYSREELLGHPGAGFPHSDLGLEALENRQVQRTERPWIRSDGERLWIDLTLAVVRSTDGQPLHLVAQLLDVTERRNHHDELSRLATTDALTGLPNRTLLLDRLSQNLAALRRTPGRVSLYLLDLDNFKNVNDTYGHPAGDLLLQEVARRLRALNRAEDTVARLGGDEFALLTTEPRTHHAQVAHGERVLDALTEPISVLTSRGEREVMISGSVGIASSTEPSTPASELYRDADLALYRAKDEGRGRVSVYDRGLTAALQTRMTNERRLRRALAGDGVSVVFQPIVSLAGNGVRAYEALVRLVAGDTGDVLAPDQFLDLAEQNGLMAEIDLRVLRRCLGELRRGDGPRALHVNVAVSTLRDPLWMRELLEAILADPSLGDRLCVEVTEHALMAAAGPAAESIARLRRHGVRVGLDDFGTGYSSLSYLQHLAVDFLKLDMSLVRGISSDPRAATLVRSVIELAHALDLKVVAEGVSSEEQRALLASWQCDAAQGFLLGRPGSLP